MDHLAVQLRDPDARVRRRAIIELGNSGRSGALKYLKYAYNNDPDPDLRKLAAKAGRHIREQLEAAQRERDDLAAVGALYSQRGDVQLQGKDIAPDISERDKKRAQGFLDRAMDYHLRMDPARTVEFLIKAFSANPALKKDTVAAGLAAEITKRPASEAVELLMDSATQSSIKQVTSRVKRQDKQTELGVNFSTASAYVVAYWLLIMLPIVALFLYAASVADPSTIEDAPPEYTETFEDLQAASVVAIIIFAGFFAGFQVAGLLVQAAAIHFVATFLFAGSGGFFGFLTKFIPFQIVILLALFGLTAMIFLEPETICLVSLFVMAGVIYMFYELSKLIARYYGYGTCSGCLTIVGSFIVLTALQYLCSLLTLGASALG